MWLQCDEVVDVGRDLVAGRGVLVRRGGREPQDRGRGAGIQKPPDVQERHRADEAQVPGVPGAGVRQSVQREGLHDDDYGRAGRHGARVHHADAQHRQQADEAGRQDHGRVHHAADLGRRAARVLHHVQERAVLRHRGPDGVVAQDARVLDAVSADQRAGRRLAGRDQGDGRLPRLAAHGDRGRDDAQAQVQRHQNQTCAEGATSAEAGRSTEAAAADGVVVRHQHHRSAVVSIVHTAAGVRHSTAERHFRRRRLRPCTRRRLPRPRRSLHPCPRCRSRPCTCPRSRPGPCSRHVSRDRQGGQL